MAVERARWNGLLRARGTGKGALVSEPERSSVIKDRRDKARRADGEISIKPGGTAG